MDPIVRTFKVTERVTLRREGELVFLLDGAKEIQLTRAEAHDVGYSLVGAAFDSVVESGNLGVDGNPFREEEAEYEFDSK